MDAAATLESAGQYWGRPVQTYQEMGERLRRFREKLHLNQRAFARLLDVTQGAIGHYESGRSRIEPLLIFKLVERTGLPLSTISYELGFTDAEKPRGLYQVLDELEREGKPLPWLETLRAAAEDTPPLSDSHQKPHPAAPSSDMRLGWGDKRIDPTTLPHGEDDDSALRSRPLPKHAPLARQREFVLSR